MAETIQNASRDRWLAMLSELLVPCSTIGALTLMMYFPLRDFLSSEWTIIVIVSASAIFGFIHLASIVLRRRFLFLILAFAFSLMALNAMIVDHYKHRFSDGTLDLFIPGVIIQCIAISIIIILRLLGYRQSKHQL